MAKGFKDHFSNHAALYAARRPRYPDALFSWAAGTVSEHALAWDCATGNGQGATALAQYFQRVIATDASAEQISKAAAHPGVEYRVEPAERCSLAANTVDLVFVSQALHWFDFNAFYAEARRVMKPDGCLVAVSYQLLKVSPEIESVIDILYREVLQEYWPAERRHVEAGYADLPFPFARIESPRIEMQCRWRLDELVGYLDSWSASQRYRKARGCDALDGLMGALRKAWGDPESERTVRWPLVILAGLRT